MLPRLVVAAPASGQGKTTVATGLMAALRRAGQVVSGHKVGPDYIDPGFHALACGRPGRNLDPHLVGVDRIVPLLLHGARGADLALVEGVMGLYDGKVGGDGFASTAHVATLTGSPVLLVVDASAASRTVGAVVHGMAGYGATAGHPVHIGGVVLNKVGSPRHAAEAREAVERAGVPVLGALPRDERLTMPSRHLGLVPAAERDQTATLLDELAARIAEHVDLAAVLALARTAPPLDRAPWDPAAEVVARGSGRPIVAMAGGRAFTFRYPETEELLRAAGCQVVTFDPATEESLPVGTAGIYLGGGFPEVHAAALADNKALLDELREAVASGVPTVAECAGLLYLCRSLDETGMVGVLPAAAEMTDRLTLAYPTATAVADTLLTRIGEPVTGHEFHRTQVSPDAGGTPAWTVGGRAVGFASGSLHASYLHVHWAGHPQLAQRFADAVRVRAAAEPMPEPTRNWCHMATDPGAKVSDNTSFAESLPPAGALHHHGDVEIRGGEFVDFAVNVYAEGRPPWLDEALGASLADLGSYPDPAAAEAAIAARHGRPVAEVLATAGAAEAFTLIARLYRWRRPVVVHPQFTEPHAALEAAGHQVTSVLCRPTDGFALDPGAVPMDADLVVVGNPTNPTGVLHSRDALTALVRPGRLVVVDEAFMDTVPAEPESLASEMIGGLVVIRSLTKHWAIPGVRAGYLVGDPDRMAALRDLQTPWSVSTTAAAAMAACTTSRAATESRRRAEQIGRWRSHLAAGLAALGIEQIPSATSFVLARPGLGVHGGLRERGIACRRADTFPGLGADWVRIAVRPPELTDHLLSALSDLRQTRGES